MNERALPGHKVPRPSRRVLVLAAAVSVAALGVGLVVGRPTTPAAPGAPTRLGAAASAGVAPGASTSTNIDVPAPTVPTAGDLSQQSAVAPESTTGTTKGGTTTTTGSSGTTRAALPSVALGPQIARTGSVDLTTKSSNVSAVLGQVQGLASRLGGSVSQEQTQESGLYPSGTITMRVPSARNDEAVSALRALAPDVHVVSVTSQSEDLTGQVVDTAARLRALQRSRDRYLDLLSKATTLGDTLQVQQRIDEVQQNIEELQGQRDQLADRTSLSTIAVTVRTDDSPVVHPAGIKAGMSKAWADAKRSFGDGVESLVAASGTAAFLLIVVIALGLLLVAVRGLVRRRAGTLT